MNSIYAVLPYQINKKENTVARYVCQSCRTEVETNKPEIEGSPPVCMNCGKLMVRAVTVPGSTTRREIPNEDLELVRESFQGRRGDSAHSIASRGLDLVATLLRKNSDYGGSAWEVPILSPGLSPRVAIQCRMSDKVARLSRLLSGETAEVDEAIEDTMKDLAGYALLWLGAPE